MDEKIPDGDDILFLVDGYPVLVLDYSGNSYHHYICDVAVLWTKIIYPNNEEGDSDA